MAVTFPISTVKLTVWPGAEGAPETVVIEASPRGGDLESKIKAALEAAGYAVRLEPQAVR